MSSSSPCSTPASENCSSLKLFCPESFLLWSQQCICFGNLQVAQSPGVPASGPAAMEGITPQAAGEVSFAREGLARHESPSTQGRRRLDFESPVREGPASLPPVPQEAIPLKGTPSESMFRCHPCQCTNSGSCQIVLQDSPSCHV